MKSFTFEDNGCPCADCERFYGNPYDPDYRVRQMRERKRQASMLAYQVRVDRERLIQVQE